MIAALKQMEAGRKAEDVAREVGVSNEALEDELERRGLGEALAAEPPGRAEVEYRKLVPIRQFRDLFPAQLAKAVLDAAGIECFLGDENIVRIDWFISNLVGGVKLLVKAEDVDAANQVLEEAAQQEFDADDAGEEEPG